MRDGDLDLSRFFRPRSVALVGASADAAKFGGRCFRQLRDFGYRGTIYPVNSRGGMLDGLPTYPDIRSLPATPDHVGIVVASKAIPEVLRQCSERGVPFATIYSSGFAEGGGADGAAVQREMVESARASGLRFMGPNCNGMINFVDGVALTSTATINGPRRPTGDVAVLGHSGGLAQVNVMWRAQEAGLGISYQVSCGNDADLDILDFARFMIDDPHTRVVLMLVETVRSGSKLRALAEHARSAGKPIVMMKLGRTEAGREAAVSHTGALAGSDAVADDVLRQLGILRVDDCHEMVETAMVLRCGRPVAGRRLAAISISGGNLVHLADQGPLEGLAFPAFAHDTRDRLTALIPNYGQASNPADVTSAAIGAPAIFAGVMEAIAEDPGIDVVVPVLTLHSREIVETTIASAEGSEKPHVLVWSGGCTDDASTTPRSLVERGLPVFRDIAPAMRAIARAARHAEWVARPGSDADGSVRLDDLALRRALSQAGPRPNEIEAKAVLAAAGLPIPEGRLAKTPEEAGAAAAALEGRLVVKLVSGEIAHKSDIGGIRLGIEGAAQAAEAVASIRDAVMANMPGTALDGFLVERMAPAGVEMILGLSKDPVLGLILTVGLGGVLAELLDDAAHRMLPVDAREARSMLMQLRGWRLLDGYRGAPPADVTALVDIIVALSRLGEAAGDEIEALDLNPVIVARRGQGAVVCDALLIRAS